MTPRLLSAWTAAIVSPMPKAIVCTNMPGITNSW